MSSEQPNPGDPYDPFIRELGVYIGSADYDEVVEAIATAGNTPGIELVARATDDGEIAWHANGVLTTHINGWNDVTLSDSDGAEHDDERSDVFIIGGRQEPFLGAMLVHRDIPLVLDFGRIFREHVNAERYSGGVRLLHAGPRGSTLTIVFWAAVSHVTDTGDVAPGMGPFTTEIRELDTDDEQEGEH